MHLGLSILTLLPKNALSQCVGWVVRFPWPLGLSGLIRDVFIKAYRINTQEAEKDLSQYPTLGEFFIRKLKPGARPLAVTDLISPVDGTLTTRGKLDSLNGMVQAKGITYGLADFIGSQDLAEYAEGGFLTVYLAPYNYHRIHVPCDGKITRAFHIPGALWPVNAMSVQGVQGLFVKNERVGIEWDTAHGKLCLVMVGATNVGRITVDAAPQFASNAGLRPEQANKALLGVVGMTQRKGEGLGCFEMGSTIIMVYSKAWRERLHSDLQGMDIRTVSMGQAFSHLV